MSREVTMPQLGFTMVEGTVSEWRKHEGDRVAKGEILMEVTTDKVSIEVEAPAEGVLERILVPEGETVPVGTAVCLIAGAGDGQLPTSPSTGASSGQEAMATAPTPHIVDIGVSEVSRRDGAPKVRASGVAKRLARQHGLDLEALRPLGSGPHGRILGSDVMAYLESQATRIAEAGTPERLDRGAGASEQPRATMGAEPAIVALPEAPLQPIARRIPFAGTRRVTGERMSRSAREAPQVTLVIEVDATEAVKLREQLLPEWERADGVRLSFNDLIVRATAIALREHPMLNATLEGDEIVLHDDVNIGIAVAVDDGLVVPVLPGAAGKPLRAIAVESRLLVDRARGRALSLDDVSGGTFTVTNLGGYGIELFTPIINPPEAAILGVGRVAERPAIHEGEICKRSLMYLSLTFDHRLADGAPASSFLSRVKELLERPYLLLT